MVQESVILTAERLRDDAEELRKAIRRKYPAASRQVTADEVRTEAARCAEKWLVEIAGEPEVAAVIKSDVLADLSVHFQRLLTISEHATTRSRYDSELKAILKDFSIKVIVPLKTARGAHTANAPSKREDMALSAFVGQSFATNDSQVNRCVQEVLEAIGFAVVTGEKPKADTISEKVKSLIDSQGLFVGIFTRRDKIAHKPEWTTSAWVIDEKAYAVARRKPIVLLKEQGVGSIGGIQGDYEFIEFSRDSLQTLAVKLLQLFLLTNHGLRK